MSPLQALTQQPQAPDLFLQRCVRWGAAGFAVAPTTVAAAARFGQNAIEEIEFAAAR
jgi:hypothetical protein